MEHYTEELLDELNVLTLFNLSNHQEGIKIHKTAEQKAIAAGQRLYEKGLISQADGGYLTDLGVDAAEHAQQLLIILKTD